MTHSSFADLDGHGAVPGDLPAPLPLAGIRVVDLTINIAGPFATMILGDLGAQVVKIERPPGGDDARRMAPALDGLSAYFLAVNRNKHSLLLDLRSESGRATLEGLLAEADVFVTNMRAPKLEALGLGFAALQGRCPRLVYADISAYGNRGPEVARPGYDMVLQARAGLMSVNGEPRGTPVRVGVSILDMGSGIWLALGVLAALRRRDVTGTGGRVSTSLLEVGASFMAYDVASYQFTGVVPGKRGSGHPAFSPYGVYAAGESAVALGVGADHLFVRLAEVVGAPEWVDDERFSTNAARVLNAVALRDLLEERLAALPASEWVARLAAAGVPADRVADVSDLLADEQLAAVDFWIDTPGPLGADGEALTQRMPGVPLRIDDQRPPLRLAPPGLDGAASAASLDNLANATRAAAAAALGQ